MTKKDRKPKAPTLTGLSRLAKKCGGSLRSDLSIFLDGRWFLQFEKYPNTITLHLPKPDAIRIMHAALTAMLGAKK